MAKPWGCNDPAAAAVGWRVNEAKQVLIGYPQWFGNVKADRHVAVAGMKMLHPAGLAAHELGVVINPRQLDYQQVLLGRSRNHQTSSQPGRRSICGDVAPGQDLPPVQQGRFWTAGLQQDWTGDGDWHGTQDLGGSPSATGTRVGQGGAQTLQGLFGDGFGDVPAGSEPGQNAGGLTVEDPGLALLSVVFGLEQAAQQGDGLRPNQAGVGADEFMEFAYRQIQGAEIAPANFDQLFQKCQFRCWFSCHRCP